MAAVFGCRSRDDNRVYPPLPQDYVEVRAEKTAIPMLLDDVLAGCRGKLGIDFHSRRAIHQRGAIGYWRVHVIKQTHVAAVATMDVGSVDHPNSDVAT